MILDLFHKETEFNNIQGYDDIKDIIIRALDTEDNYNFLFIGPPASAKTLFLLGILDMRKDGVYFDGSNTTNRILDVSRWGTRCAHLCYGVITSHIRGNIRSSRTFTKHV